MNKARRNALRAIGERLEELQNELEELLGEEEEARDNIPENLWGSERYEKAEEACGYIEDAISAFDEIIENIEAAAE